MTDINHAARKHSVLGASKADRWMNCAASVRLTEGLRDDGNEYSRLGTAAHQLVEHALRTQSDAIEHVGTTFDVEGHTIEVDEEMADAVQDMLDHVRRVVATEDAAVMLLEQRFSLEKLHPGMFGTSDVIVYLPYSRHLHVIDYKHGQGYAVGAANNPQLRYYGIGALLDALPQGTKVDEITLTIVQPRAPHQDGRIRSETIDYLELVGFAGDLVAAAEATEDPNAEPVAGPWCRFCPASGRCPAQLKAAQEAAMAEFDGIDEPQMLDPRLLDTDTLVRIYSRLDTITAFVSAVKATVTAMLERGEHVPGYKLTPKRANRKWAIEEDALLKALNERYGLLTTMAYQQKLKSPAQIEKVLKDHGHGRVQLGDEFTVKESSGFNVVPEGDDRPGVVKSAADDFDGTDA